MASFTGTKIKDTYPSILKVFDNGALDGTVQVITDGLGNSSALWLGTAGAYINGTMSVEGNFTVDTDTLRVDTTQDRVGINVGSPTEALDVLGNIKASGTLAVSGISTFDNKVGIGSSSFEAFDVLHISGTNAVANDLTFIGPSTSQVRIKFGAPSSLDGEIAYDNDAKSMKFRTNSSERLLLNSSGASVSGNLDITENLYIDGDLLAQGNVTFDSSVYVGGAATLSTSLEVVGNQFSENGDISLTNGDLNLTNGNLNIGGSIIHLGDTNTYFNFPSADNISLVTGGTQRFLVNNAGATITGGLGVSGDYSSTNGRISLTNGDIEVGGGISIANSLSLASFSPNANLLVIGDTGAAANQGMTIVSPTGATGNIYFADGTTGTELYRGSITYNHNVDTLYLGAAAANKVAIDTNGASVTGTLAVSGAATLSSTLGVTGAATLSSTLGVTGNITATSATFNHNDAPSVRIQRNGGTDANTLVEFTNSTNSFFIGSNGSTMGLGGTSGSIPAQPLQVHTSGDISFRDSSANEAFYWDASAASLGIGTNNPKERLEISGLNGNIRLYGRAGIGDNQISSNVYFSGSWVRDNSSYGATAIRMNESGFLAFHTTSATSGFPDERMRIDSSGNVVLNTGGSFTTGTTNSLRFSPSNSLDRYASVNAVNDGSNNISLYFETRSGGVISEKMRILSSGGITFNGDTSTANALDDYEEGTFTPIFTTTGTDFTSSGNASTGKYTKIGNLVTVQVNAVLSGAVSGGTGNVVITGMPFTAGNTAYGVFASGRVTISGNNYFALISNGTTSVTFSYINSGTTGTTLPASDINGNSTPFISTTITYQV